MKQKVKNGRKNTKFKFPVLNILSSFELLGTSNINCNNNINCRRAGLDTGPSTREGSTVSYGDDIGPETITGTKAGNKTGDGRHNDKTNTLAVASVSKACSTLQDELAVERSPRSTCRSSFSYMAAQRRSCSIESFLRLRNLSDELSVEMEKRSHTSVRSSCSEWNTEHSFVSLATSVRSIESRLWRMCMSPYRSSRDSDMYDKLDSRKGSKHLSPPDYNINPQTLLESYVEKKVRFAGVIPDVQIDDVTNRTDVLRIIDEGKKDGKVHHHTTDKEHGTMFTLNVHNIKLTLKGEMLLRICMHEIAAVCYIKDDSDYLLPIKYGVPDKCNLAILCVDSRMQAEEICALVDQCFQLVYTEAAIQFIDTRLTRAIGTSVPSSNTQSDSTTVNNAADTPLKPSYITTSDQNLTKTSTSSYARTSPKRSNRTISVTTDSEISFGDYFEVLQDYMKKLHKCLSAKELRQFAGFLRAWHNEPGATTSEFCEKVFNLYGQERKHMLAGMGPFIPAEDYPVFEEFLTKNAVTLPANGHGTISSFRSCSQLCSNSVSDMGTSLSVNGADPDEFDRMMDCISDQIDNMENSVEVDSFVS